MSQFSGMLSELLDQVKRLADKFEDLLVRVAGLERDREWDGRERRRDEKRFESGDQTFERMREQIRNSEAAAERAEKDARRANARAGALEAAVLKLTNAAAKQRRDIVNKLIAAAIGGLGFGGAKLIEWWMK